MNAANTSNTAARKKFGLFNFYVHFYAHIDKLPGLSQEPEFWESLFLLTAAGQGKLTG
jgi:hypothetical protein